jgi:XXXCH domain-containing protein
MQDSGNKIQDPQQRRRIMTLSEGQKHEFKQVKRRLSAIQKMIKMDLKEDQLPQKKDVSDFVATSGEMNALCPKEWRASMDDYMNRLQKFQDTLIGGDPKAVNDAFRSVLDGKVSCHKEFRQKS